MKLLLDSQMPAVHDWTDLLRAFFRQPRARRGGAPRWHSYQKYIVGACITPSAICRLNDTLDCWSRAMHIGLNCSRPVVDPPYRLRLGYPGISTLSSML